MMRTLQRSLFKVPAAILVGLSLATAACSEQPAVGGKIEIINWWARDGEASAMAALIDAFEAENADQQIQNTWQARSSDARKTIRERMAGAEPPEIFQANGGWDLLFWVLFDKRAERETKMEPLPDVDTAEWAFAIPEPVRHTVQVRDAVRTRDNIYGVPLNVHRVNTVFFNPEVFQAAGLPEPTSAGLPSIDHLFTLLEQLRTDGLAHPLALGMVEPWTLGILFFENILVARAGGPYYRQFFAGNGDPLNHPDLRAAVRDLTRLLSYAKPDSGGRTWDEALALVRNGDAALTIMGDWAKGYFTARDKEDGVVDVRSIPMPGTDPWFVFTTDTFGLPQGVSNREGALRFLRFAASPEGQRVFNINKGSIPARDDVNSDAFDKATIDAFRSAAAEDPNRLLPATAIVAPSRYTDAIFSALSDFVGTSAFVGPVKGNESVLLHAFANWSDVLVNSDWE